MNISRYTYLFKSTKNGNLIYNARTNSFAELSDSMFERLEIIRSSPERINELFTQDDLDILSKTKILVKENEDDDYVMMEKLHYFMSAFSPNYLNLTIAPTTDCNFRCPYCYEENKAKKFITTEVEDAIVNFIIKHEKVDQISLTWYGGEPLLTFQSIKSLYEKMSKIEGKKIIHHSIITNGYLMDKEKCSYFKEHKLNLIQFTLDGCRETHNKIRLHKNKDITTYDRIVENIELCAEQLPETDINIRVHVDENRLEEYAKVHGEMKVLCEKYHNIHLTPGFITDYERNCELINRQQRGQFFMDLYHKYNIDVQFYPRHEIGGCGATCLNSYVIGPEGELYKCWVDVGKTERIVGSVVDMKLYNEYLMANYLVNANMYDDAECQKCMMLPICDGGCPIRRLNNKKKGLNENLCTSRKDFLQQYLETHYEIKKKQEKIV